MFSVDLKHCYYPKNYDNAVYHKKERGPNFGGGVLDLRFEPMNGENKGVCLTGDDCYYQIPKDDAGNSSLTGQGKDPKNSFTCVECEVY